MGVWTSRPQLKPIWKGSFDFNRQASGREFDLMNSSLAYGVMTFRHACKDEKNAEIKTARMTNWTEAK